MAYRREAAQSLYRLFCDRSLGGKPYDSVVVLGADTGGHHLPGGHHGPDAHRAGSHYGLRWCSARTLATTAHPASSTAPKHTGRAPRPEVTLRAGPDCRCASRGHPGPQVALGTGKSLNHSKVRQSRRDRSLNL